MLLYYVPGTELGSVKIVERKIDLITDPTV